jgi:hypothetical protein
MHYSIIIIIVTPRSSSSSSWFQVVRPAVVLRARMSFVLGGVLPCVFLLYTVQLRCSVRHLLFFG